MKIEIQKKDPQKKHLIDYEKAGMFYGYPETAIKSMEIKKEAESRGERIDNFVSASISAPFSPLVTLKVKNPMPTRATMKNTP